jgi:DNA-binding transcriptional ArsR family regulator
MTSSVQWGEGDREIQDAVSYAVGHRIRVEILTVLHEVESASAMELARTVRQPLSTVTHHLSELLKSDSIRIERTEKVRSVEQRFYGLHSPLFVSDEEWEQMSEAERQTCCGIVLQSVMAEALAAFGAGKIASDPRQVTCWAWFNVDEEGRAAIAQEQIRSWQRIEQIAGEARARYGESGEEPSTILVSSLGFERVRPNTNRPPRPVAYEHGEPDRDEGR